MTPPLFHSHPLPPKVKKRFLTRFARIASSSPGREDDPNVAELVSVGDGRDESPSLPSVWSSKVVPLSKTWLECV